MITFTPDFWARGLDVNVRRIPPTDEIFISPNLNINSNNESKQRQRPTSLPPSLSSPSVSPPSNTKAKDISSVSGHKYVLTNTSSKSSTNAESPPKKKTSIVQKLFHVDANGSNKLHHNPLRPTITDDKKLMLSTKTPGNKSILREVLSLRLNELQKSKNDQVVTPVDNECLLAQRYGTCEKGCIGRGATAVVRLAHKLDGTDCEKIYAVKEFRKRRKNETEKDYIKKLTSEFCISSSLDHENIVKTVDLVQDENHNWCEVMEYCSGGDLFLAIKANHMSPVEIDCCFKQLINGVGYLHSMGVAHRDIKPENLLLDEHGHLKITDFGVSDVFRVHWESNAHLSTGLCGSEPYIAPELFMPNKEYDARLVDVWACGIVYYCMVYQGIPFRMASSTDSNYLTYLEERALHEYEPFERLPRGCRNLMYRILEPDPCMRYDIDSIKADPWFQGAEMCSDGSTLLIQEHHHIPPESLKKRKSTESAKF